MKIKLEVGNEISACGLIIHCCHISHVHFCSGFLCLCIDTRCLDFETFYCAVIEQQFNLISNRWCSYNHLKQSSILKTHPETNELLSILKLINDINNFATAFMRDHKGCCHEEIFLVLEWSVCYNLCAFMWLCCFDFSTYVRTSHRLSYWS